MRFKIKNVWSEIREFSDCIFLSLKNAEGEDRFQHRIEPLSSKASMRCCRATSTRYAAQQWHRFKGGDRGWRRNIVENQDKGFARHESFVAP